MRQPPTVQEIRALPAEVLRLPRLLDKKAEKELEGYPLKPAQIARLHHGGNLDVYDEETGACLLKLRRAVVPREVWEPAYRGLRNAAVPSDNRGMAAGNLSDEEAQRIADQAGSGLYVRVSRLKIQVITKKGHQSKIDRAKSTMGGIVGYFGRTQRQPFCRLTKYAMEHFEDFKQSWALLQWVGRFYEALMPEAFARQAEAVAASSQDFVIPGTPFSTVTVNRNFMTACHYDSGDFRGGFGNLVVVRQGKYQGAETCFPSWGVGVDVRTGDILLMDVHQLHGNLPMQKADPNATRLAMVLYFREDIQKCGTAEVEVQEGRKLFGQA